MDRDPIERLTANRVAVMNGLRQAGHRSLANQVGVDLAALADEGAELDTLRALVRDLCKMGVAMYYNDADTPQPTAREQAVLDRLIEAGEHHG